MMGYLDDNTSAVKNAHYYRRELKKAEQHIRELEAELAALRQQQGKPVACEKMRFALENCRLLAARHRKEDWALLILGFCAEGGVVGSVTR